MQWQFCSRRNAPCSKQAQGRRNRSDQKDLGLTQVWLLKAFVFKGSPLTAADLGSCLNFAQLASWTKSKQNLHLQLSFLFGFFLVLPRESKRSGENSDIFTLTCTQFPQFSMVPMYIDKRLVLYPKRFKTSNVYFNKSVEAFFSALNYFLHLF